MKSLKSGINAVFILVLGLALSACTSGSEQSAGNGESSKAQADVLITGAGASFPYPLYAKWFSKYREVDTSVKFNYQSIGSGGGIRQFLQGTTDFGASDAPMKDYELAKADKKILHIPTVLGAVAVTFNIPGVEKNIKLTPDVLVKLWMGEIKKWNHPSIQKINPDVNFPKDEWVIVCNRSDGSGTTSIFTDYMSKVSEQWKDEVGHGKSAKWPTGLGGKGNEGVTGLVKQNPGSIGYVELTYALSNNLPVVELKNQAGQFVEPSVEAVSAAANGAIDSIPDDFRTSITNAKGKKSYPISGFTYLLVHQEMLGRKGEKIVEFLNWAMGPGQEMAPELNYAPLPEPVVKKVKAKVESIRAGEEGQIAASSQ